MLRSIDKLTLNLNVAPLRDQQHIREVQSMLDLLPKLIQEAYAELETEISALNDLNDDVTPRSVNSISLPDMDVDKLIKKPMIFAQSIAVALFKAIYEGQLSSQLLSTLNHARTTSGTPSLFSRSRQRSGDMNTYNMKGLHAYEKVSDQFLHFLSSGFWNGSTHTSLLANSIVSHLLDCLMLRRPPIPTVEGNAPKISQTATYAIGSGGNRTRSGALAYDLVQDMDFKLRLFALLDNGLARARFKTLLMQASNKDKVIQALWRLLTSDPIEGRDHELIRQAIRSTDKLKHAVRYVILLNREKVDKKGKRLAALMSAMSNPAITMVQNAQLEDLFLRNESETLIRAALTWLALAQVQAPKVKEQRVLEKILRDGQSGNADTLLSEEKNEVRSEEEELIAFQNTTLLNASQPLGSIAARQSVLAELAFLKEFKRGLIELTKDDSTQKWVDTLCAVERLLTQSHYQSSSEFALLKELVSLSKLNLQGNVWPLSRSDRCYQSLVAFNALQKMIPLSFVKELQILGSLVDHIGTLTQILEDHLPAFKSVWAPLLTLPYAAEIVFLILKSNPKKRDEFFELPLFEDQRTNRNSSELGIFPTQTKGAETIDDHSFKPSEHLEKLHALSNQLTKHWKSALEEEASQKLALLNEFEVTCRGVELEVAPITGAIHLSRHILFLLPALELEQRLVFCSELQELISSIDENDLGRALEKIKQSVETVRIQSKNYYESRSAVNSSSFHRNGSDKSSQLERESSQLGQVNENKEPLKLLDTPLAVTVPNKNTGGEGQISAKLVNPVVKDVAYQKPDKGYLNLAETELLEIAKYAGLDVQFNRLISFQAQSECAVLIKTLAISWLKLEKELQNRLQLSDKSDALIALLSDWVAQHFNDDMVTSEQYTLASEELEKTQKGIDNTLSSFKSASKMRKSEGASQVDLVFDPMQLALPSLAIIESSEVVLSDTFANSKQGSAHEELISSASHPNSNNNACIKRSKQLLGLNSDPMKRVVGQLDQKISSLSNSVIDENQFSYDAGLLILWPFLSTLFQRMELLVSQTNEIGKKQTRFASSNAQDKAYSLLRGLLGEQDEYESYSGAANILVGYQLDTIVEEPVALSESDQTQLNGLLTAAISQWDVLKNMPVASFQSLFLRRECVVASTESGAVVTVEKHTLDVLMQKMPWGVGMITLPWLDDEFVISVDWPY